ncbi:vWA domain-containing protein [Roseobacteraceae bacterium S113]
MSDDLDDLAKALHTATPAPDAARKAEVLARAQENFEKSALATQGLPAEPRQSSDRSQSGGLVRGLKAMFATLSTRAAFAGSTAVALVALIAFVPLYEPNREPLRFGDYDDTAPAPVIEAAPVAKAEADARIEAPVIVEEMEAVPMSRQRSLAAPAAGMATDMAADMSVGITPPMPILDAPAPEANTEAFPEAETNPLKITSEDPVSTFSIDVDTANYALLRNMLQRGQLPAPETVRIEELINYFTYDYAAPTGDAPFSTALSAMQTPWNSGTQLVRIGLQGALPEVEARPPLNLVFLIDTSGSMQQPGKLPLLKQSLSLMLAQMRPEDEIAIVAYAGSAGTVLAPTPVSDAGTIRAALNALEAGGSTAGQAGLEAAYALAEQMTQEGDVSRVLLATDGDFNVGLSDPQALESYIAAKRDSGTYLSVLGFGRGNLQDATMQALAQNGNGTASYIDTLSEAQKVLVNQLSGALFPIANDVKIQVEWNPAQVAEYRLIGYETRALNREDFNNDKVDAGEIGAGHQVTALYEITPVGSSARLTDELRYSEAAPTSQSDELGFLRLRYKAPGAQTSQLIEQPITQDLAADTEMDFAAAIAGFGQILRGATYLGDWGWDEAIALAQSARGEDRFGYRTEAITLMRLGQSLSAQ